MTEEQIQETVQAFSDANQAHRKTVQLMARLTRFYGFSYTDMRAMDTDTMQFFADEMQTMQEEEYKALPMLSVQEDGTTPC